MTLKEFEDLIAETLDSLPEQFAKALDNVEIVAEIWPTRQDLVDGGFTHGTLFGLYRGVPQTKRGTYQAVLPDRIVIFAGPIVAMYGENLAEVKRQVRDTVLHEIGHHFGMNDKEIYDAMAKGG